MTTDIRALRIAISPERSVSALLRVPHSPRACFVLAHGAGAGMTHPFIAALALALSGQGIATLRFQFPYMEQGGKRPDAPAVAQATVRAAVCAARSELPRTPLFAGGKSFGARMTSETQAESPLPEVQGLIFVGFPLHPSGKPSIHRAAHLGSVGVPMLFLQGTRDLLADLLLIKSSVGALGERAQLHVVEGADHAFHVLARSGRTDADVVEDLALSIEQWISRQV